MRAALTREKLLAATLAVVVVVAALALVCSDGHLSSIYALGTTCAGMSHDAALGVAGITTTALLIVSMPALAMRAPSGHLAPSAAIAWGPPAPRVARSFQERSMRRRL